MATEYGSRLKTARKHAGLTQVALSKKTGIPQSTISTAEREGNGSGETPVYAQACGVDALWLATGEGEMIPVFLKQNQPLALDNQAQAATNNIVPSLAQSIQALSQHLVDMDVTTRRRAGRLLADLADEPHTHAQITDMLEAAIRSAKPGAEPVRAEKEVTYASPTSKTRGLPERSAVERRTVMRESAPSQERRSRIRRSG